MRLIFSILPLFFLLVSCNLPESQPLEDPFEIATEIALTGLPTRVQPAPIPTFAFSPSSTPDPAVPTGKIAYVCQVFKVQYGDQICIMDADGGNQSRLTTEDYTRHFYPSISPDGESVIYAQFGGENIYDIYEITLD
ncbi:MAG: hypothetical protein HN922_05235, partial [Anaerolineae bacterium]|nr:hypothetical protein [Anaerolineae bacterium]